MGLKVDEQKLLADYHHLPDEGKKELQDYAAFLVKKYRESVPDGPAGPEDRCILDEEPEKRPEAAKEPIFTE